MLEKIVSGGQTGADRGALDAALAASFPCGGWCPLGRKAEDGVIPYLSAENWGTRKVAAEILKTIGTNKSLPALQRAAQEKDHFVKSAAQDAINAIRSRNGKPI